MQEWVDTLRSKLREMKIISPKENLYSRMPEMRPPLLPTRDPTSPLPAPPPVPAASIPGIERVLITTVSPATTSIGIVTTTQAAQTITSVTTSALLAPVTTTTASPVIVHEDISSVPSTSAHVTNISTESSLTCTGNSIKSSHKTVPSASMSNTLTQNLMNLLSNPIASLTSRLAEDSPGPSTSNGFSRRDFMVLSSPSSSSSSSRSSSPIASPSLAKTFVKNVLNGNRRSGQNSRAKRSGNDGASKSSSDVLFNVPLVRPDPIVIPRPQTKKACLKNFAKSANLTDDTDEVDPRNIEEGATTNITIIQVSDINPTDRFQGTSPPQSEISFTSNISVNSESAEPAAENQVTTVQVVPSTSAAPSSLTIEGYGKISNSNSGVTNISVGAISNVMIQPSTPSPSATDSAQIYEPVFVVNSSESQTVATPPPLSPKIKSLPKENQQSSINSQVENSPASRRERANRTGNGPGSTNETVNCDKENLSSPIPSTSSMSNSVVPKVKKKQHPLPRPPAILTRGITELAINRPSRSDRSVLSPQASRHSNRESRSELEHRKRSSSSSDQRNINRTPFTSPPRNIGRQGEAETGPSLQVSGRLSLREQQVFQLRREMRHPGGVRLQLRRKDCIGSIAWVDAFGSVFVAGWKQKDHPMLYNALHIGDQLVSVGGVTVASSVEANKLMRSPGIYVELIIRRVPFGRVYAIRRDLDGQCLGLIRDSNTATIVDIIPNSLTARHGLPAKAKSCDGLSLTFWVLTEINGRPLNLFFKDTEIQDRLNAVGRDISILVQPQDLVVRLKKQLKSMRGHKEFIVQ